jgi:Zn-dependent M28 family amino/carboxypeptidase
MACLNKKLSWIVLILFSSGLAIFLSGLWYLNPTLPGVDSNYAEFNGKLAYQTVQEQLSFGSRAPGKAGHQQFIDWIQNELTSLGWSNEVQQSSQLGHPIHNIIAKRGDDHPWIILGTHYDTRQVADNDPNLEERKEPVPGGNDGASGVAVLLELARILPSDLKLQTWLVFFDAEDNGNIPGWDWALGSRAFVNHLEELPDAVVIIDMVGDVDLNIYKEMNSTPQLASEIWDQAKILGYDGYFIDQSGYSIIDDHMPFLMVDIPSVLIIDLDYPYWHTTEDTADKISARSMKIVGETLYHWLSNKY